MPVYYPIPSILLRHLFLSRLCTALSSLWCVQKRAAPTEAWWTWVRTRRPFLTYALMSKGATEPFFEISLVKTSFNSTSLACPFDIWIFWLCMVKTRNVNTSKFKKFVLNLNMTVFHSGCKTSWKTSIKLESLTLDCTTHSKLTSQRKELN